MPNTKRIQCPKGPEPFGPVPAGRWYVLDTTGHRSEWSDIELAVSTALVEWRKYAKHLEDVLGTINHEVEAELDARDENTSAVRMLGRVRDLAAQALGAPEDL